MIYLLSEKAGITSSKKGDFIIFARGLLMILRRFILTGITGGGYNHNISDIVTSNLLLFSIMFLKLNPLFNPR